MNPYLALFHVVGYGLLLLTLFDVLAALIPFHLSNPGWRFQTAGNFVEHATICLIGFILVFYGDLDNRKKKELSLLKGLSWLTLIIGIFYFALVVVFFITPPTLNDSSQERVRAEFAPRIAQAQEIQSQLNKAEPVRLEALMKNNRVTAGTDPQTFKAQVMKEAATAEQKFKDQADNSNNTQRLALFKDAIKWGLGSMVIGVIFIRIWAATEWSRE